MVCNNCGYENDQGAEKFMKCNAVLSENADISENKSTEEGALKNEEVKKEEQQNPAVDGQPINEHTENEQVVVSIPEQVESENLNIENKEVKIKKGKKTKKIIISSLAAIIIIAVLGTIYFINPLGIFRDKNSNLPVVYIKDNELLYRNLLKDKSVVASSSIFEDEDNANTIWSLVRLSDDGKKLFFIGDIDDDEEGNLYYTDTTKGKPSGKNARENAIKIASNVSYKHGIDVSEDGKTVMFFKDYTEDEGGILYVYNSDEPEKIDADVFDAYMTNNGEYLFYIKNYKDREGDLYFKNLKNDSEPEKIDSEVTEIYDYFEDSKSLYYTKVDDKDEDTVELYVKEIGKDKKKLASDIYSIEDISEKGTILFKKLSYKKYGFEDIFEDDTAESDAEMVEPQEPDYDNFQKEDTIDLFGYAYTYTTTDYEAYSNAYREYLELYNKYNAKLVRDKVRSYYKENPIEVNQEDLYIIKGDKEEKIAENVGDAELLKNSDSVLYSAFRPMSMKKIKMSTIESEYDTSETSIRNKLSINDDETSLILRTSKGKNITVLEDERYNNVYVNDDLTKLYLISEYDGSSGILMEYTISGDSVKGKKKIDDDVSFIIYTEDFTKIYYIRNKEDSVAELYVRKGDKNEKIGEDVYLYSIDIDDERDILYFIDDYNSKNESGQLSMIKNGRKTKIADDVSAFVYREDLSLLYLSNYNADKRRGVLWYKNNSKRKPLKIDEDVSRIVY